MNVDSAPLQPPADTIILGERAEVAELVDALDSKSSGASPRAGSIPAFGISSPPRHHAPKVASIRMGSSKETTARS